MRRILLCLAVFAFCSVFCFPLTAVGGTAPFGESEAESFFHTDRPIFADTGMYLGQKRSGARIWSNFYFGTGTLKPKTEAALEEIQGASSREADYFGIQLGLDLPKSGGIYSTFFFNANQSEIDFAGASSEIDNFLFGYGKYMYFSLCHIALTGSVSYDRYEIATGGISAKGSGLQTNFFGEFGLDFILGKLGIKPFYALQYDFLYHGRIGDPGLVLAGDWNGHGLQQLFGMRINWKVWDMLELQGRTVWVHEMLGNTPPFYRGRFSPVHGTCTPAIMFYDGDIGRDWAWIGCGAKFEGIYGIYFFGDYDLLINERHTSHLGSLGMCLSW